MEFKFLLGPEVVEAESQMPTGQRVTWPDDTVVLYVFDGDEIVARMAAMNLTVLEGTWIREDHRGSLAHRLMQHMERFLVEIGKTHSMALSFDPVVAEYLSRLGYEKMPVEFHTKNLVAKSEAA